METNNKGNLSSIPEELRLPIAAFMSKHPDYQIIYLHIAGSKLYGTSTPDSDTDYRGIFIPSHDSLLSKTDINHWKYETSGKDEKNKVGDVDLTLWSIHKFLGMLQGGDTNAFDTLFSTNTQFQLHTTSTWNKLFNNWKKYEPRSLKSFFGYALGQVKKYSLKGNKLQDVQKVIQIINENVAPEFLNITTIEELSNLLPITDQLKWVEDQTNKYYQVLDKRFIVNVRLLEFLVKLEEMESKYGSRAKSSMENGQIDYKAMYHAFRVMEECRQLMANSKISFPLENAEFLMAIRNQQIAPSRMFDLLEERFDEISEFEKSELNVIGKSSPVSDEHKMLFLLQLVKSIND